MQKITWHAFAINGSLTKTILHFFGHSKEVSAPYPLQASIKIFCGNDQEAFPLSLDGARLQTPEGVRLDSIIEHCSIGGEASLFGIELTLISQQTRVSLEHSQCVFELDGKGYSTLFRGKLSAECSPLPTRMASIPLVFDTHTVTSLIFVNPTDTEQEIPIEIFAKGLHEGFAQDKISPRSTIEVQVPEPFVQAGAAVASPKRSSVAGFAVYRDAAVRRAMSVVSF